MGKFEANFVEGFSQMKQLMRLKKAGTAREASQVVQIAFIGFDLK